MKALVLLLLLLNMGFASDGEDSPVLTKIFQPLRYQKSGRLVQIHPVVGQDSVNAYGISKASLITAANAVPTNDSGGPENMNLASLAGISIEAEADADKDLFRVDLAKVNEEELGSNTPEVFRATLECLRLTFPKEVKKAEIQFTIPKNMPVCRKIADEFLSHDKSKPFYIQLP